MRVRVRGSIFTVQFWMYCERTSGTISHTQRAANSLSSPTDSWGNARQTHLSQMLGRKKDTRQVTNIWAICVHRVSSPERGTRIILVCARERNLFNLNFHQSERVILRQGSAPFLMKDSADEKSENSRRGAAFLPLTTTRKKIRV